jgi:signal transduction histidine kinase
MESPAGGHANTSVLVVEDERLVARDIGRMLLELGYSVAGYAVSSAEAVEKARATRPDIVLMDVRLDGNSDGTDAAFDIHQEVGSSVIYLTAFSDQATLIKAKRANPLGYILKPFTMPDLTCALEIAVHRRRVDQQLARSSRESAPTPNLRNDGPPASIRADATMLGALEGADATTSSLSSLQQENRDLRAYGAALVDELRHPMSTMRGSLDLVLRGAAQKLSADEAEALQRMDEALARMKRLANDIDRLAHLENQLMQEERVDLAALADKPLRDLRRKNPERVVQFKADNELLVRGDARLLQIALENLIRNAWKFTANRATASIRLGRATVEGQTAFFVQDNGVGFDSRLASKLSRPFVRLHYATNFEGTGLGLFIARRIIERHGGQMWAHSSVDYGATFFFTLPFSTTPAR